MAVREADRQEQHSGVRGGRSKVPEATALFWIIKVLTTGMGETASDFLAHRLGPVPAVGLTGLLLLTALAWQGRARQYVPGIYWTAVTMVSVFGTVAADVLHVGLDVPYAVSTVLFAGLLAGVFFLWFRVEGTLSIHSITSARREGFYWAAVLGTFALGTAAGDWTARTLGLGWLGSALVFTALIAVPPLMRVSFGLGEVLAFWWAYVLTRPLGASVADWMAVPRADSGLGWGTGAVTLGWAALIAALVAVLALSGPRRGAVYPRYTDAP